MSENNNDIAGKDRAEFFENTNMSKLRNAFL